MCILSGCDYLPSLAGVGLAKAEKFIATIQSYDVTEELPNIEGILGPSVKLESGYIERFKAALFVFNHHIVFDENKNCLVPFKPHTQGSQQYVSWNTITRTERQLPLQGTMSIAMSNLDNSSCHDTSYDDPDLSYDSDGSRVQQSYLLRSRGLSVIIDEIVTANHKWTVPCLPVLTLSLAFGSGHVDSVPSNLAFNMTPPWSTTKLPDIIPRSAQCRSNCQIDIDGKQYVLLWVWEFILDRIPSEEASPSETSSDKTDKDSDDELNSQSESENVVIVSDDDKATSEHVEHCLPSKVMGSVHSTERQNMLMEAKNDISLGEDVAVTLQPEPHNVKDPNVIQVILHSRKKSCCVGYIQRELTKYVQPLISASNIVKVNVAHIKFQLFNPPGFYMKINVTRKGRWEAAVLRKSLSVR